MSKILVIDDNADIREITHELLSEAGFEVIEAGSGQVGLEIANLEPPDLILCDVVMPDLDGYEVLKGLRRTEQTSTIPFIFLTSLDSKAAIRQGMGMGADDYLTKPLDPEELLQAINARLHRQTAFNDSFQKKLNTLSANLAQSLPHELNTPLSIILMSAEVLQSEQLTVAENSVMCRMLNSAAHRLQSLIEKYLLYSELEILWANHSRTFQKCELTVPKQPVTSLIREIAIRRADNANRMADLKLELTGLEGKSTLLNISDKWLKHLVDEVIFNAFQYSRSGQPVTIQACQQAGEFVLNVHDRGYGMTAEQIASIGAYVQFDRKLHAQQGFGLGLVIVKRLADLHGGRMLIDSLPGLQTTLTVYLPLND